ncbi:MAG: methyltransferase domain-containing protein [Chloroflexi bacterium]|nr:methyltransferase domain-containing protein [Chloroflexota bacterium]
MYCEAIMQPRLSAAPITAFQLETTVPAEDKSYVDSIREWIFSHTGLHFGEKKYFTLYRRLQTVCWRMGIPNLREMDRLLHAANSSHLAVQVVCAVSTNHTFFFRELEVLQQITTRILPQMDHAEELRIWSAAAASGEEAYTIGILLGETLGMTQALRQVSILGTDISHPMIDQAEHGVYDAGRMELIATDVAKRYFEPVGLGQWRVIPALKQLCTFRRMNLQSMPWPFKNPFHVIVCRNVLYYFDVPEQKRLVEEMYDWTMPGGWLITSVTETLSGQSTRWHKVDIGLFQK